MNDKQRKKLIEKIAEGTVEDMDFADLCTFAQLEIESKLQESSEEDLLKEYKEIFDEDFKGG